MLDDLYQEGTDAALNDMARRPPAPRPTPAKFSAWGMLSGAPRGMAAGAGESAGGLSDVLGAFGQAAATTYTGDLLGNMTPQAKKEVDEARQKMLREGLEFDAGDSMREWSRQFMPDPATAHAAEQLTFGLFRFGAKAVGYSVLGGPAVGAGLTGLDEGLTAAEELKRQGVDPLTRMQAGAVAGVAAAAGVALPVVGKTAAQTAALVAAGGPGAFIGQQAATREILNSAGYEQIGMQYDPLDPVGLAVATLVPAGFGAFAMRGARARQRLSAERANDARADDFMASQAADLEEIRETEAAQKPTPQQVDAARVDLLAQHIETARLSKAGDFAAARMHVEAFAKAMEDLSTGRRVDVTELVPVERLEAARALDTFAQRLEGTRADLMAQAAMRAEPGAVRQLQSELVDVQARLAEAEDPAAIKARAGELQQAERMSYKQALAQAKKEFGAQADDLRSRMSRIEGMLDDNAQGQQAFDALNLMDRQAEQARQQRSAIDAPATRQTPTAAAAKEAVTTPASPKEGGTDEQQATQVKPGNPEAGATPASVPAPGAQPAPADAGSAGASAGEGSGSGGGSAGGAAEAGVVAQRLSEIQAQFPDLEVQMDGMDKPVRLADFLADVQREAMEGTDFDLGGNDAPLMQVAASCFLLNG